MIYPVITLYQPWATWIMRGWKTIETRTHNRFSGLIHKEILMHAGMKTDKSFLVTENPFLTKEQIAYKPNQMINGAILGKATVDAAGWLIGDPFENKHALIYTQDRYGLFLTDVERWEHPILTKGAMGIWYFDMDTHMKVPKPKN